VRRMGVMPVIYDLPRSSEGDRMRHGHRCGDERVKILNRITTLFQLRSPLWRLKPARADRKYATPVPARICH